MTIQRKLPGELDCAVLDVPDVLIATGQIAGVTEAYVQLRYPNSAFLIALLSTLVLRHSCHLISSCDPFSFDTL